MSQQQLPAMMHPQLQTPKDPMPTHEGNKNGAAAVAAAWLLNQMEDTTFDFGLRQ